MPQKLNAGKRWVSEVLEELGGAGHEWGSPWDHVPKRRGASPRRAAEQLILSAGGKRKIVWLPIEELREAGTDGVSDAKLKLRDAVAGALGELLHSVG